VQSSPRHSSSPRNARSQRARTSPVGRARPPHSTDRRAPGHTPCLRCQASPRPPLAALPAHHPGSVAAGWLPLALRSMPQAVRDLAGDYGLTLGPRRGRVVVDCPRCRATRFRLSSLVQLIEEWERPASRPLRPRDGAPARRGAGVGHVSRGRTGTKPAPERTRREATNRQVLGTTRAGDRGRTGDLVLGKRLDSGHQVISAHRTLRNSRVRVFPIAGLMGSDGPQSGTTRVQRNVPLGPGRANTAGSCGRNAGTTHMAGGVIA
jgi:hypothetical protein